MQLQKQTKTDSGRKRLSDSSSSPVGGKSRSRTLKSCPICQKEIYNLPDHMKTHSNERPYVCTLCPISFKRKGDLNRHIRNTHRTEPEESKNKNDNVRDSITELASLLQ